MPPNSEPLQFSSSGSSSRAVEDLDHAVVVDRRLADRAARAGLAQRARVVDQARVAVAVAEGGVVELGRPVEHEQPGVEDRGAAAHEQGRVVERQRAGVAQLAVLVEAGVVADHARGARREHGRARADLVAVGPVELAGDGQRAGDQPAGLLEARDGQRGAARAARRRRPRSSRGTRRPAPVTSTPSPSVTSLNVPVCVTVESLSSSSGPLIVPSLSTTSRRCDALVPPVLAIVPVLRSSASPWMPGRGAAGVVVRRVELDPPAVGDRRALLVAEGAQVGALLEPQQARDDELRGSSSIEAEPHPNAFSGVMTIRPAGGTVVVPGPDWRPPSQVSRPVTVTLPRSVPARWIAVPAIVSVSPRAHRQVVGDLDRPGQLDRARERALADEDDAVGGVGAGERARVGLGRAVLEAQLADLAVDDAGVVQRRAERRARARGLADRAQVLDALRRGLEVVEHRRACRGRRSARGSRARGRSSARRCR